VVQERGSGQTELLGVELDEHIANVIEAMRGIMWELGIAGGS
jgi:predicted hydrolase (HD superfamily)